MTAAVMTSRSRKGLLLAGLIVLIAIIALALVWNMPISSATKGNVNVQDNTSGNVQYDTTGNVQEITVGEALDAAVGQALDSATGLVTEAETSVQGFITETESH